MSTLPSIALETAKHQFAHWRTTKKYPRQPIPDSLWALLPPLMTHYPASTLAYHLNISTAQFKKKFSSPVLNKKIHNPAPAFVEVPLENIFQPASMGDVCQPTVTVERASGVKLIITDVSSELLARLIQQFMD